MIVKSEPKTKINIQNESSKGPEKAGSTKNKTFPNAQSYSRSPSYKEQSTILKVIAFKIPIEFISEIDFYHELSLTNSRSEVIRIAFNDYIDKILFETDNFDKPFFLSLTVVSLLNTNNISLFNITLLIIHNFLNFLVYKSLATKFTSLFFGFSWLTQP